MSKGVGISISTSTADCIDIAVDSLKTVIIELQGHLIVTLEHLVQAHQTCDSGNPRGTSHDSWKSQIMHARIRSELLHSFRNALPQFHDRSPMEPREPTNLTFRYCVRGLVTSTAADTQARTTYSTSVTTPTSTTGRRIVLTAITSYGIGRIEFAGYIVCKGGSRINRMFRRMTQLKSPSRTMYAFYVVRIHIKIFNASPIGFPPEKSYRTGVRKGLRLGT